VGSYSEAIEMKARIAILPLEEPPAYEEWYYDFSNLENGLRIAEYIIREYYNDIESEFEVSVSIEIEYIINIDKNGKITKIKRVEPL
jgi:hypothetical protein